MSRPGILGRDHLALDGFTSIQHATSGVLLVDVAGDLVGDVRP